MSCWSLTCHWPILHNYACTIRLPRAACQDGGENGVVFYSRSMWQGRIDLQREAKETSFLQLWWHPWRKTSTACCNQGSLWWFTPSSWESSHTNEEWAVGWFFCGLGRGGCHPKQSCPTNCCRIVSLIRSLGTWITTARNVPPTIDCPMSGSSWCRIWTTSSNWPFEIEWDN